MTSTRERVDRAGATPSEAMTWGKVDPAQLPDTVTCYADSTLALPLLTAYALATRAPRKPRRLMERMGELMGLLEEHYRTKSPREKGGTSGTVRDDAAE